MSKKDQHAHSNKTKFIYSFRNLVFVTTNEKAKQK